MTHAYARDNVATIFPPHGRDPLPPMTSHVLLRGDDSAWVPHPFRPGAHVDMRLCAGVAAGWTPLSASGVADPRVIIVLGGGNNAAPTDEMIAFYISRRGLRELIADLQSVADQMEAGI